MRYLPLFLATPAFAHDGAHVHPHGVEAWALLTAGLLAAIVLWVRR